MKKQKKNEKIKEIEIRNFNSFNEIFIKIN